MTPPPPFEKEFFVRLWRTASPFLWQVKYEMVNGEPTEVVG